MARASAPGEIPRGSVAIAAFYFAFIGALGLYAPYFPIYLRESGLAPHHVAEVMALSPLAGLVTPPLVAALADLVRAREWLLRLSSLAAAITFLGFFAAGRSLPVVIATASLFALARMPLWALTDSAALDAAAREGGSYGRIRVWGSIGFLLAVLGGGALLERAGATTVMKAAAGGLFVAAAVAWIVPRPPRPPRRANLDDVRALLRDRPLAWVLGAMALGQLGFSAHDSCLSLHYESLGLSPQAIGALWAIGVLAEIVLLAKSARLIARFGGERLFAISLGVATARWGLMAVVRDPIALGFLASTHAISFGLYYVSAVALVHERATDETRTAAQGLFAAASAAGSAIGMPIMGALFERHGGGAMFSLASVAALLGAACAIGHLRSARASRRR